MGEDGGGSEDGMGEGGGSTGEGSGDQSAGGSGGGAGASGGDPADQGWVLSNELPNATDAGPGGEGDGGGDGAETDTDAGGGGTEDDALAEALEDLDGEILEQQVSTRKSDQGLAGGTTRGGGDPEDEGTAPPAPPDQPPVARIPEPVPPDRPDARDDDVVARQLREAAMAENDPDLRESLWEEYQRYKSGL